jgi:hypothetical protein
MTPAEGEIARFDHVGLRYGSDREVLNDIGFSLHAGHFYFLTGASGAENPPCCGCYLAQRPTRQHPPVRHRCRHPAARAPAGVSAADRGGVSGLPAGAAYQRV